MARQQQQQQQQQQHHQQQQQQQQQQQWQLTIVNCSKRSKSEVLLVRDLVATVVGESRVQLIS